MLAVIYVSGGSKWYVGRDLYREASKSIFPQLRDTLELLFYPEAEISRRDYTPFSENTDMISLITTGLNI